MTVYTVVYVVYSAIVVRIVYDISLIQYTTVLDIYVELYTVMVASC